LFKRTHIPYPLGPSGSTFFLTFAHCTGPEYQEEPEGIPRNCVVLRTRKGRKPLWDNTHGSAGVVVPGAEREKFDEARARRKEQAKRKEQINLAIDRLLEMGLPITSVACGVVTIDFNQMFVLA